MSTVDVTQGIPQEVIDQFSQIDVACITDVLHGLRLNPNPPKDVLGDTP